MNNNLQSTLNTYAGIISGTLASMLFSLESDGVFALPFTSDVADDWLLVLPFVSFWPTAAQKHPSFENELRAVLDNVHWAFKNHFKNL